jgi:hypothetical protein
MMPDAVALAAIVILLARHRGQHSYVAATTA